MALELLQKDVKVSRVICRQKSSTVIENDIIVPDSKPDISKILIVDAEVYKSDVGCSRGMANVSGTIRYKILYVADDEEGSVRSIVSDFPFTVDADAPGAEDGMYCNANCVVEYIEYEVSNSRKLGIKTIMETSCKVREEKEFLIAEDIEGEDDIQQLRKRYTINSFTGRGTENFIVSDSMEIPAGKTSVVEVLRTDTKLSNLDCKVADDKVVVKGEVNISTLYTSDDEERKIESVEYEIPFTQFIEIDGIEDDCGYEINCEITDALTSAQEDIDGELRLLDSSIELTVDASGFRQISVDSVADAYSPKRNIKLKKENIVIEEYSRQEKNSFFMKEMISIDDNDNIGEIFNVIAKPKVSEYTAFENKLTIEGLAECNILYVSGSADQPVRNYKQELPFKQSIAIEGLKAGQECEVWVDVQHLNYSLASSQEVDLRLSLDALVKLSAETEIPVITEAEEEETAETRSESSVSVLIYFAKAGDSLWNIAKKYRTTVEAIERVNELETGAKLVLGQQIFIPKKLA
ncbi:MAG: DUF3794 domain-containing protein [Eubacteriales bacterium]|nr:DUF3794 domain-containing protein [Eubacteriales bacterium]